MAAVDIGIGHDDNLVVTEFLDIEVFAYAGAKGSDHGTDGVGIQDSVKACLFDVQDLAAERKDSLETAVTAGLCRSACGVTFDDVDFKEARIFFRAVGQLAREAGYFKRFLSAGVLPGMSSSLRKQCCRRCP